MSFDWLNLHDIVGELTITDRRCFALTCARQVAPLVQRRVDGSLALVIASALLDPGPGDAGDGMEPLLEELGGHLPRLDDDACSESLAAASAVRCVVLALRSQRRPDARALVAMVEHAIEAAMQVPYPNGMALLENLEREIQRLDRAAKARRAKDRREQRPLAPSTPPQGAPLD